MRIVIIIITVLFMAVMGACGDGLDALCQEYADCTKKPDAKSHCITMHEESRAQSSELGCSSQWLELFNCSKRHLECVQKSSGTYVGEVVGCDSEKSEYIACIDKKK